MLSTFIYLIFDHFCSGLMQFSIRNLQRYFFARLPSPTSRSTTFLQKFLRLGLVWITTPLLPLRVWWEINQNAPKIWLSRPKIPVVRHQDCPIWLKLKPDEWWFMKRFTWRSNEIKGWWGWAKESSETKNHIVLELPIGREISVQPTRCVVSYSCIQPGSLCHCRLSAR